MKPLSGSLASRTALALSAAVIACLAMPPGAVSQEAQKEEAKKAERRPIPYVPSPQLIVDRMLELAKITKDDFVIDLGSGDGRIPITAAARYGARGFGVDIEPKLVELANKNAEAAGVGDRVEFRVEDLFKTDFSKATVISLYLFPENNAELRPRFLNQLRPGTRIVAHQFALGDWDSDYRELINHRFIHLWFVPAKVEGTWQVTAGERSFNLYVSQTYQKLMATASNVPEKRAPSPATVDKLLKPGADEANPKAGGAVLPSRRHFSVSGIMLRGDEIRFEVTFEGNEKHEFHGRVDGERIEPHPDSASNAAKGWNATRVSDKTRPDSEGEESWLPQPAQ